MHLYPVSHYSTTVSDMDTLTIIVLDLKDITGDPKLGIAKVPSTLTVKRLKKRLNHILVQFHFPFGDLAFYQRGMLLLNYMKMINLPQGTITCKIIRKRLNPVKEIKSSFVCHYCGQEYFFETFDACVQCA